MRQGRRDLEWILPQPDAHRASTATRADVDHEACSIAIEPRAAAVGHEANALDYLLQISGLRDVVAGCGKDFSHATAEQTAEAARTATCERASVRWIVGAGHTLRHSTDWQAGSLPGCVLDPLGRHNNNSTLCTQPVILCQ